MERKSYNLSMSIAIDGPAGAGKSTIAMLLAEKYNLMYINTGAMYRAVTFVALKNSIVPENIEELEKMINKMDMKFVENRLILNDRDINDEITSPYISNNVSNYAAVPIVRELLVNLQRIMAGKYDVIMDGRDIGSVVLKDSKCKFYLTATAEKRASRRFEELNKKGVKINYNDLLNDIIKRDYIDTHRELNPLTKCIDAIELDTSDMNIDEVVECISSYIDNHKN